MKAILKFNLDDEDDKINFGYAKNSAAYHCILVDIDNCLRSKLKYGEHSEMANTAYEEMRDKLHELLLRYEITL